MRTPSLATALAIAALAVSASPAAAAFLDPTVTLDVENNTGHPLVADSAEPVPRTMLSGGAFTDLLDGQRGHIAFESSCGGACPTEVTLTYATADNATVFIRAHNAYVGTRYAVCLVTPPQAWQCDVEYGLRGKNLWMRATVYRKGTRAPAAKLAVHGPRVHGTRDVVPHGLPYIVRASRTGTVTTTLVPLAGSGRAASATTAIHARGTQRIHAGGHPHHLRLKLNRAGRSAARRPGAMRYTLRSVFRSDDGHRAVHSRTVVVVDH